MYLVLENESKEHLSTLAKMDSEIAKHYCLTAKEFILNGVNQKFYSVSGQKHGFEPSVVKGCLDALMHILVESTKLNLSKLELEDSLLIIGLTPEVKEELLNIYLQNSGELRQVLKNCPSAIPHFMDLQWRLDVQLGSRNLHHMTTPLVMLQFTLSDCKEPVTLQTDPANLQHMLSVLEEALAQSKSQHTKRTVRGLR